MANEKKDARRLVTENLNVLRVIQAFQYNNKTKFAVDELAKKTNMAWSSVKNVLNSFISHDILDKDYKINPSSAYFMGISVSWQKIDITIVGLDGRTIDITKNGDFKIWMDNFNFKYSLETLNELSRHIKDFINGYKSAYPIKSICFSFDEVDFCNKTFSLRNYLTDSGVDIFPFEKVCQLYFGDLMEDVKFYLDCNSASYVLSKEFPYLKRKGNRIYLYLTETGCFITPVIDNKICLGYNQQTLNVTRLLSSDEKQVLLHNNATKTELASILHKITTPFIIALSPDELSIASNLFCEKAEIFEEFLFQSLGYWSYYYKGYIYPEHQLDIFPNVSFGTAMSAMYQYYDWNLNFI